MARNNRGYLRVPRSKRKNEQNKKKGEFMEALALSVKSKFEQAALTICGITVSLMLDELEQICEEGEHLTLDELLNKLHDFIKEQSEKAETMVKE